MRLQWACVLGAGLLVSGASRAQESGGALLSGSLLTDLAAVETFGGPFFDQFDLSGMGRLTLNLRNRDTRRARIDASADLILLYGLAADLVTSSYPDAFAALSASDGAVLVDIRKLYGALYFPFADVSVGRQIINFGYGQVFSPLDIFSSVDVLDLAFRRSGSDVARVKVPFGPLAGADVVARLSSRSRGAAAAGKFFWHAGTFDFSAVGMYRGAEEEVVSGLGLKGDLVLGVHAEAVEHWSLHGGQWFLGMTGADYSIGERWLLAAEYHYNERPGIATLAGSGTVLPGRHSAFASVQCRINDLMSVSLAGLGDIEDGYGMVTAQYFYNVFQNVNATVYVRAFGDGGMEWLADMPDMQYGLRLEMAL